MQVQDAVKILRERFGNVSINISAESFSHDTGTVTNQIRIWIDQGMEPSINEYAKSIETAVEQCFLKHEERKNVMAHKNVESIIQQVEQMAKG